MEFDALVKTYGVLGAGGLALIVLIWLLVHLITKVQPLLLSIQEDSRVHTEIIKNNTEAIKEVSMSNKNVATALKLLNLSFESFSGIIEKHDNRAESMQNEMIKMSANIENMKDSMNKNKEGYNE